VAVSSDLPSAAGLSSSSALLAGFAIALLKANLIQFRIEELLDILPEGEHFVGTRGGGMDHAAVLASRAGCALLIGFAPFALTNIPIPPDWSFLVAHSLTTAEKSGAVLAEYNSRRTAGIQALEKLGLSGYKAGLEAQCNGLISKLTSETERMAFLHVTSEASRVQKAVSALDRRDAVTFGELLNASHASLRDRLKVSNSAIDLLARAALEAGALGARLTGAGFGGCVLVFCRSDDREHVRTELIRRYYAQRCNDYDSQGHVFVAEPSAGALGD
jgi:galactokinase